MRKVKKSKNMDIHKVCCAKTRLQTIHEQTGLDCITMG